MNLQTLSPEVVNIITLRIANELYARYVYESATAFCRQNGYNNAAAYYEKEALDEGNHAKKLINFLSDWNVNINFLPIKVPVKFNSLIEVLEMQYTLEFEFLGLYENDAVDMFPRSQAAYKLLQEFVQIQNESVIESNNLLTKAYKYQGTDPNLVLFEEEAFNI